MPFSGSSSAMNRYPNAGSSASMSTAALAKCASAQSRVVTGLAGQGVNKTGGSPLLLPPDDVSEPRYRSPKLHCSPSTQQPVPYQNDAQAQRPRPQWQIDGRSIIGL
jgi:hypothetical protein